jgi:hypothetical protein
LDLNSPGRAAAVEGTAETFRFTARRGGCHNERPKNRQTNSERASGTCTRMSLFNPTAIVVAHPGHEVHIQGFVERERTIQAA